MEIKMPQAFALDIYFKKKKKPPSAGLFLHSFPMGYLGIGGWGRSLNSIADQVAKLHPVWAIAWSLSQAKYRTVETWSFLSLTNTLFLKSHHRYKDAADNVSFADNVSLVGKDSH